MGLFGGDSKSSTDSTQNEIGFQGADQAVSSNVSGIKAGRGNIAIEVNSTDHGSIERAFSLGNSALDLGNDLGNSALNLGNDAIAANLEVVYQAGEFLSDTSDSVREVSLSALDYSKDNNQAAFTFVGEGMASALDVVTGASNQIVASSDRNSDRIEYIAGMAVNAAELARTDNLNFSAGAIESIESFANDAAIISNRATTEAFAAIETANKSESSELSDKLVIGLMVLFGVFALRGSNF
jgi:hypothetical protein